VSSLAAQVELHLGLPAADSHKESSCMSIWETFFTVNRVYERWTGKTYTYHISNPVPLRDDETDALLSSTGAELTLTARR